MSRLCVLLLLLTACVERRLFIRTEPEGAIVRVNGDDVGRSPVSWRFNHYGTVLVEIEKEGHQPVQRKVKLESPWYQKPVVDFFADIVIPMRIHDDHEVLVKLKREPKLSENAIDRRIRRLADRARLTRQDAERE